MSVERGSGGLTLPVRKQVTAVIASRYGAGRRPLSWDERRPGIECVRTADGELIYLASNGQQSSPAPGWELLLTAQQPLAAAELPKFGAAVSAAEQPARIAYSWTLYGIRKGSPLGRYADEASARGPIAESSPPLRS